MNHPAKEQRRAATASRPAPGGLSFPGHCHSPQNIIY